MFLHFSGSNEFDPFGEITGSTPTLVETREGNSLQKNLLQEKSLDSRPRKNSATGVT